MPVIFVIAAGRWSWLSPRVTTTLDEQPRPCWRWTPSLRRKAAQGRTQKVKGGRMSMGCLRSRKFKQNSGRTMRWRKAGRTNRSAL